MTTSDNETFDEVFTEAMNRKAVKDYHTGVSNGMKLNVVRCVEDVVDHYAMRFRDAHAREVSELKNKCEEYERQPELMAETAKAALELLKKQESEIAELRACLREAIELHCINLNGDCLHCIRCGVCSYLKWRKALEGAEDVK